MVLFQCPSSAKAAYVIHYAKGTQSKHTVYGKERKQAHAYAQGPFWQFADEKGVQYVGYVFIEKRPGWAVVRIHFPPASEVHRRAYGDEEYGQEEAHYHLPGRRLIGHPEAVGAKEEQQYANEGSHQGHWMQTRKTALEKASKGHLVPAVVIGIAYHESGQQEKEIHGHIPVIDYLGGRAVGFVLEYVKCQDQEGCHSPETVKDLIPGLGRQVHVLGRHSPYYISSV